jgi:hypothetical protein
VGGGLSWLHMDPHVAVWVGYCITGLWAQKVIRNSTENIASTRTNYM